MDFLLLPLHVIVSPRLYVLLLWNSRLYRDAGRQVFLVLVGPWGWRQWLRRTEAAGWQVWQRLAAAAH